MRSYPTQRDLFLLNSFVWKEERDVLIWFTMRRLKLWHCACCCTNIHRHGHWHSRCSVRRCVVGEYVDDDDVRRGRPSLCIKNATCKGPPISLFLPTSLFFFILTPLSFFLSFSHVCPLILPPSFPFFYYYTQCTECCVQSVYSTLSCTFTSSSSSSSIIVILL